MRNRICFYRTPYLLLAGVLLVGCAEDKDAKNTPPPPMTVEVASVVQKDVPIYSEWIGQINGSVNADIKPKVEGYLLNQIYTDGSLVQKGQTLFTLDPRQTQASLEQAEANLAHSQATLQKWQQDVARYKPLVAQRAISQQELDNAISGEQAARASVDASQAALDNAKLNRNWSTVRSPISGIIGISKVAVGDLVTPATILATVSTLNPVFVDFNITEQEYLKYVRSGLLRRKVKDDDLELILADGSIYPIRGKALLLNRAVDPSTGTLAVRGEFKNPNNFLRPGQYALVRAITEIRKDALLIPQRAVSDLQGSFQVAVVGADGKVAIRPVKVGPQLGPLWVIDSGISAGDKVIVEGIQKVRDGVVVKTVPAKDLATGGNPASGD
jgi:membrane fusion protein (multidrug efflux system)